MTVTERPPWAASDDEVEGAEEVAQWNKDAETSLKTPPAQQKEQSE